MLEALTWLEKFAPVVRFRTSFVKVKLALLATLQLLVRVTKTVAVSEGKLLPVPWVVAVLNTVLDPQEKLESPAKVAFKVTVWLAPGFRVPKLVVLEPEVKLNALVTTSSTRTFWTAPVPVFVTWIWNWI